VMLDDLTPRDARNESGREMPREKAPTRPVADREVPLKKHRTPPAIHAWLDGELPEAAVRRGNLARDVEFWRRIEHEMDERRHMRTPVHVERAIMAALPQTTPSVITPWWRRPFAVTPAVALAVSTGILAFGLILGSAITRLR
jgi:anti-sigma factor RsiW